MGSGAFKFAEWKKGSHVTMEANPDYHWGRPYVDKLVLRFITSPPSRWTPPPWSRAKSTT